MSRFRPRNKSYWLAQLCESNFRQLCQLVPDLTSLPNDAMAAAHGKPPLHLKVVDRSAYTLTLELSHCFGLDVERLFEPGLRVRVYLDGQCAEALPTSPQGPRRHPGRMPRALAEVLDDKWASNYFLQRWLEHCIRSRYRFAVTSIRPEPSVLACPS